MNDQVPQAPRHRGVWIRWSWRDLRHHWVAVVVIALVMAIGIGVYAGLGSTATWRRMSNDGSFAALDMHDLQITLSPGTFIDQGELLGAVESLDDPSVVAAASERLVVDSQIDASTGTESILVAARIVGMDVASGDAVDDLWVSDGQAPATGSTAGVLEAKFADHWDLPARGRSPSAATSRSTTSASACHRRTSSTKGPRAASSAKAISPRSICPWRRHRPPSAGWAASTTWS